VFPWRCWACWNEPSHGYELKRDYGTSFGRGKPLRYSQVHATLSRLARGGKAIAGIMTPDEGEMWFGRPSALAYRS
jgi:hypothetical protein